MGIKVKEWGRTAAGETVQLITFDNGKGQEASVSSYGATLVGMKIPFCSKSMDVVLGFESFDGYLADRSYFGATVGRTANRISKASINIDGTIYKLDKNEGGNNLHGGMHGFSFRNWSITNELNTDTPEVKMNYESPAGEGGFPGTVRAQVTYTLIEPGLRIEHCCETDTPCPVNMTAHPYFNLASECTGLADHNLRILSGLTLERNEEHLPTGRVINIKGTEADFTEFAPIDGQSETPTRHDRFYPLKINGELAIAAEVECASSGLRMEVFTTHDGIQFYSGDYIPENTPGKNGCIYGPRSGFCIEPHGYPDAPNRNEFPSVTLRPGEKYKHITEYRFSRIQG